MKIKNKTRSGDAIPYSPNEALQYAVQYGVKSQNTKEKTFWPLLETLKQESFSSFVAPTQPKKASRGAPKKETHPQWEAKATGSVMVGWTCTKTDRFYKPKLHKFSITYKSSKDNLGLPDITVVEMDMVPISNNPQKLGGFAAMKIETAAPKAVGAAEKVAPEVAAPKPVIVESKK